MQKNKLAMCKRIFKDFQAKKLVDDKNFLVIDWKNKNGSGEYSIRYTLDIEKGNFIVTGDVGYCIASWYNHLTPDNLFQYTRSQDFRSNLSMGRRISNGMETTF